ncbi:hypothetical protein J2Z21_006324 [Streptomyces griseochromogenes]|uniref:Uncharacterized protein n=1 Tax=Streptomyces griseochromogenes TaxID=68214 RepID=A0ABS4M0Y7_9ACTN|nr:glycoside hydrolase family 43 protein [Streptomyces griseochromogenes]MBP2053332.1 hypothetical protein [Streptomyces griseochromogenes]
MREKTENPDIAGAVDVQEALRRQLTSLTVNPRHGTVLPVTGAGYERLLRTYG